ncbi:MAG: hypothetical protein JXR95_16090 [Deltaproteobacteria bacterium]|nr:hypothetical protein [Deltaproteobacteria bacterium]
MKLSYVFIILLGLLSCKRNENTEKKQIRDAGIKPGKKDTEKIVKTVEKFDFPLGNEYRLILEKGEINTLDTKIKTKLKVLNNEEISRVMNEMVARFRENDKKKRIAAALLLSRLPVPETWIDTVNDWMNTEKKPDVRSSLYELLGVFTGERMQKLFVNNLIAEKDWNSFKHGVKVALKKDLAGNSILLSMFPSTTGFKRRFLLMNMKTLPESPELLEVLRTCTLKMNDSSGRCWINLSLLKKKQDYQNIINILDKNTGNINPFSIGSLLNWSGEPFFDRNAVISLYFKISTDIKQKLTTRQVALGELGKIGKSEELEKLLNYKWDKAVFSNVEKAKWRIRRRLGLPAVKRIEDIKKHKTEKPKKLP